MTFFDLSTRSLQGEPLPLDTFRGQVVLAVNVASACGYTPQYTGLEALQARYRGRGFTVLGFPCNQFGGQEPGSAAQIEALCRTTYGATFPMAEKMDVKGPAQSPVYAFLAQEHGEPQWNFHKYLVGRDGRVIRAFPSSAAPEGVELKAAIEAALDQPPA